MSQSSGIRGDLLFLGRTGWFTLRFTTSNSPTLRRVATVQIVECMTQEMRSPWTGDEFAAENPSR